MNLSWAGGPGSDTALPWAKDETIDRPSQDLMPASAVLLVAGAALVALVGGAMLRRRRRTKPSDSPAAGPGTAVHSARLSAIHGYVQPGHPDFEHQSRDLKEHMRAAFAVAQAPPLPNPQLTGQLAQDVLDDLGQMLSYVATNWQISPSLAPGNFLAMIGMKTGQTPSYLTVYGMASTLFRQLTARLGSAEDALAFLYASEPDNPPEGWDVVKAWVMNEFTTLCVSQGGFTAYGWKLYPGFQGGPFDNPGDLPYRALGNAG